MKKTEKPYVSPSLKMLTIAIQRCIAVSLSGSTEDYDVSGEPSSTEILSETDGSW